METFQPAPPAAVSRVLATFDRDQLAGFVAVAIDLLDLADGDTDVELNGDEEDSDGDERGDQAWIEWHTMRGSQKRGPNLLAGHEDDEDNDPLEDDDPDFSPLDLGELTSEEQHDYQGTAGTRHEHDDDEPHRVPPHWPVEPANMD
jgi:hypothetical protein